MASPAPKGATELLFRFQYSIRYNVAIGQLDINLFEHQWAECHRHQGAHPRTQTRNGDSEIKRGAAKVLALDDRGEPFKSQRSGVSIVHSREQRVEYYPSYQTLQWALTLDIRKFQPGEPRVDNAPPDRNPLPQPVVQKRWPSNGGSNDPFAGAHISVNERVPGEIPRLR